MKTCVIVGAGEFNGFKDGYGYNCDYIIAADGGYQYVVNCNRIPNLLIGDFDSIAVDIVDIEASNTEIIRYPAEKNASDIEIAVEEAIKRGFDCFYLYGVLGKRLDHSLANISVLSLISQKGLQGWLIGENEIITAVTNSSVTLSARQNGIISVFAFGGAATGVNLSGVKYPLNNAVLRCNHYSLGLSNEFIGEDAVIAVDNGCLVVIVPV